MNCRRAKKVIFESIDGLSTEKAQIELQQHLAECPLCDQLALQLKQSQDLLHSAPQEKLDENFNWKVRLAIHKERNAIQERAASQGSLFRAWNFRFAASAVSGFAVILVAGWLAINAGLTPVPVDEPVESNAVLSDSDFARMDAGKTPAQEEVAAEQDAMAQVGPQLPSEARMSVPGAGHMVSTGADALTPAAPRPRAIEHVAGSAVLDSLVQAEMQGLSEPERVLYLEQRIELLRDHLQKCKAGERP